MFPLWRVRSIVFCGDCRKPVHLGKVWWVHDETNDIRCNPAVNNDNIEPIVSEE